MTGDRDGFRTVRFEKRGDVGIVVLDRPTVRNAFDTVMRDELWQLFEATELDDEIRALVIRGAGPAFCAGADLTEFGTAPSPFVARRIQAVRDVFLRLGRLTLPKIAALHGHVIGSGLELALMCDLRIADTSASFAMPEARLGLMPAAGGTQQLPRVVGPAAALDLLLTGRRVEAAEALDMGLVHQVVQPERLDEVVMQLAGHLASLDPAIVVGLRSASGIFG